MTRHLRYGGMPKGIERQPSKRRCSECHATATHAEIQQRPAAVVRRDGTVARLLQNVTTYWCDEHTGITCR